MWDNSNHTAQGDKAEVNSLNDEEEDEDDEVTDLKNVDGNKKKSYESLTLNFLLCRMLTMM